MSKSKSKEDAEAKDGEVPGDSPQPHEASEFEQPYWAVISFRGLIAENLTYPEALEKVKSIPEEESPGLCVVTNQAAQRLSRKEA